MASHVIGPLATFNRPLVDEELPTLARLPKADWAIDMDLLPTRGTVELSTILTVPHRISAPTLARRHESQMRRDRG